MNVMSSAGKRRASAESQQTTTLHTGEFAPGGRIWLDGASDAHCPFRGSSHVTNRYSDCITILRAGTMTSEPCRDETR